MNKATWKFSYLALWGVWASFATVMGIMGGRALRPYWIALMASFFILEGIGAIKRIDGKPMLTEVIGRYVPGWITFPVLAIATWRLYKIGVPDFVVVGWAAWQNWHFIATYHAFQKLGGK